MTLVKTADQPLSASSGQRIYDQIRRRIILGEIPQGARLPEQRLADELDTSRIPMREALSRLEAEGFVELRPRRGAIVTTWTAQDVHHLFDARLSIESTAANKAAQHAGEGGEISALEVALQRSEGEMTDGDDLTFAEANVNFHQALVAMAGNPLTDRLMASITGRMAWLFHLTSLRDHEVACREHRSIVDAVRSGNPRLAETLTYSHIEVGRQPSFDVLSTLIDLPENEPTG